jgi:zinc protease
MTISRHLRHLLEAGGLVLLLSRVSTGLAFAAPASATPPSPPKVPTPPAKAKPAPKVSPAPKASPAPGLPPSVRRGPDAVKSPAIKAPTAHTPTVTPAVRVPAPKAAPSPTPKPSATPVPTTTSTVRPAAAATISERPPGKAVLFDPATISLHTLPNGVRGVVKETRGTGLVAVQVWVRAGSRYETGNNVGVSRVIEALALQSSKNYPGTLAGEAPPAAGAVGGVRGAIEALGGVASSQTARDSTNYSATVAAAFLPAAIRALADAALHPNLADSAVEEAKADIEEDLRQREANPVTAVTDLAFQTAFAKHPYRWSANGSSDRVEKLTGSQVRAYHHARYVGPNISVIVVGDLESDTAHKLIAQSFGLATATRPSEPTIGTENAPVGMKTATRRRPVARTALALGFRAPGIKDSADVVAMDVLLAYWGEGRDAAMRRTLLGNAADPADSDQDQADAAAGTDAPAGPEPLALAFDVGFLTQRDPGLFIISLVIEPDKRAQVMSAVFAEISRVQTNGIDASALVRARKVLSRQYIQQSETVSGQAGALGFYEMIASNGYEFAVTYLDRIEHITAADIKRVANKYLSSKDYVQVAIEPAPRPPGQRPDTGDVITA